MDMIELNAEPRSVIGKQVGALRRQAITPGIIYGSTTTPVPVQFDAKELTRVVQQAGRSSMISVKVAGTPTPYKAIVRDLQFNPIKRTLRHIDLQALSMTETVRLPLHITLTGEAPVTEEGGMVLQQLNQIEIECLPDDLIHSLEIDISILTEIGQTIYVKDITPPSGITFLTSPEETIVQVTAEASEQQEDEEAEEDIFATAPAADSVEVIRKDRGEEAAE